MTDLDAQAARLREAAQKATPGPWKEEHDERGYTEWEVSSEPKDRPVGAIHNGHDAAYIALANPATILALLDERERREAERADLWRANRELQASIDLEKALTEAAEADAAALRKALEEIADISPAALERADDPSWVIDIARSALTTKGTAE